MTTLVPVPPATAAVLSRLAASGLPVGDARKPDAGGWQGGEGTSPFVSYLILYPINHDRFGPDAPIADRGTDPQFRYQVTAVGIDRRAAESAADLATAQLLNGAPFDIPDRAVVQVVHESGHGPERDETPNPPLFYAIDRWRLDISHT